MERLEETLTLHRLGLFERLGRSLKATNCIENLNSQLVKYIGRVKRWMESDQRQRWVAMGLLEVEQKMRQIDHAEHLPLLRAALLRRIERENPSEAEPLAEEDFNWACINANPPSLSQLHSTLRGSTVSPIIDTEGSATTDPADLLSKLQLLQVSGNMHQARSDFPIISVGSSPTHPSE